MRCIWPDNAFYASVFVSGASGSHPGQVAMPNLSSILSLVPLGSIRLAKNYFKIISSKATCQGSEAMWKFRSMDVLEKPRAYTCHFVIVSVVSFVVANAVNVSLGWGCCCE